MQHRNWHHDFEYSNNLFNKGIGSEEFFRAIEVALPPVVMGWSRPNKAGSIAYRKTYARRPFHEDRYHYWH